MNCREVRLLVLAKLQGIIVHGMKNVKVQLDELAFG